MCDAYDRQQGTYSKKLTVLCPDQNKKRRNTVIFIDVPCSHPTLLRIVWYVIKPIDPAKNTLNRIDYDLLGYNCSECIKTSSYRIVSRRRLK